VFPLRLSVRAEIRTRLVVGLVTSNIYIEYHQRSCSIQSFIDVHIQLTSECIVDVHLIDTRAKQRRRKEKHHRLTIFCQNLTNTLVATLAHVNEHDRYSTNISFRRVPIDSEQSEIEVKTTSIDEHRAETMHIDFD
jgi:hypothetical protein